MPQRIFLCCRNNLGDANLFAGELCANLSHSRVRCKALAWAVLRSLPGMT